jgi:hypothetical protein
MFFSALTYLAFFGVVSAQLEYLSAPEEKWNVATWSSSWPRYVRELFETYVQCANQ